MADKKLTFSHWGSGLVETKDGVITAVHPHPSDPNSSRINENIPGSLNGSARVLKPAIRKSWLEHGPLASSGERGNEIFVEVSWEKAFDLVAGELKRVRSNFGNESIFAGSYGWASAGRFHHAQSQLKRFLATAGGFVFSEGNYSYNAALVLMPHIVGNFRHHVKEATRWTTVARQGELVVMFGGIPLRNAQVATGGVAKHRLKDDLISCAKAGVRFVNFSPLKGDALQELKAEWIAPRPGSDTAIMMAIAQVLLEEGLYDRSFIDRYTVGFEKTKAYLMGECDGVAKTPKWAEELSGVRDEKIRSLAREMASKRTLVCTAVSLQRADWGEQPLWMTVTLAAMLGQIGLPGGGYGIGYGSDATIGTMDRGAGWPSFPLCDNPVETFIPVAMTTEMLMKPGQSYDYNGQKVTFPDIRLLWWAGGNPFHHHQDLNRLREAFQRPETIVVNEINWTATARHADIVLPVAAPQERTDFGAGRQDNAIIPMPKSAEPPGEAKEEYDIYCELERRLELDDRFSLGRSADEWLVALWEDLRATAKGSGKELPSWTEFLKGDIIEFEDPHPNAVFLKQFRTDPEANALPTPSGKIELASKVIASFKYEDCPGHPVWREPRCWKDREDYPLHLVSGQPETRLHSQHDSGSFSLSRKIKGREPILMHPEDAKVRSIDKGDIVVVSSPKGSCLAGAQITEDIAVGTVFLWTGAWYDPDFSRGDRRDRHGNPNVLTHDLRTSRLSQGPAAQSAVVEIKKFSGSAPEVESFIPPIEGSNT